jgi:hypothetical protein
MGHGWSVEAVRWTAVDGAGSEDEQSSRQLHIREPWTLSQISDYFKSTFSVPIFPSNSNGRRAAMSPGMTPADTERASYWWTACSTPSSSAHRNVVTSVMRSHSRPHHQILEALLGVAA